MFEINYSKKIFEQKNGKKIEKKEMSNIFFILHYFLFLSKTCVNKIWEKKIFFYKGDPLKMRIFGFRKIQKKKNIHFVKMLLSHVVKWLKFSLKKRKKRPQKSGG